MLPEEENDPYATNQNNNHHRFWSQTFWWIGMLWPVSIVAYRNVIGGIMLPIVCGLGSGLCAFLISGILDNRCDTRAAIGRYLFVSFSIAVVLPIGFLALFLVLIRGLGS